VFRICFIDDDDSFEIPLFCEVFGEDFEIVTATDYAELKSQIDNRKGWKPDLFVLDLYFPYRSPNKDKVEALRAEPLSVENDNADIRSAYENYVKAGARLHSVIDAWNQNADGGLRLGEKVAADYPRVPIVFYSRKATFEDVVRCTAAKNVWCVERKPTGRSSAETVELTREARERIGRQFKMAILKIDLGRVERLKRAAEVLLENLREFN